MQDLESTRTQQEFAVTAGNDPGEIALFDILIVLVRRWRLLILLPLSAGLLALGVSFLVPPVYTASTQLLSPQQPSSTAAALLGSIGGAAGALGGSLSGLKNPADQWIGLLRSRIVVDSIVKRFELKALYEVDYEFQARNSLAANSRITVGKDGLIGIEVDDESPERSAQLVAAYVEELQRLTNSLAVTEASQRRLFFQRQLADAKDGLVKAEVALKEGGINASVLKTSPEAAVTQLAQAQAALAAQEVKLSVMRGSMTVDNPEFKQAALELASLREQLQKVEQDKPGQAQGDAAQYVTRYREFKYYETLFELFARQYELARADEAKDGALVQVVDPVLVPEYKSRPKRALIATLVTMFALILCASYVAIGNALEVYQRRPDGRAKLAALRRAVRSRDKY